MYARMIFAELYEFTFGSGWKYGLAANIVSKILDTIIGAGSVTAVPRSYDPQFQVHALRLLRRRCIFRSQTRGKRQLSVQQRRVQLLRIPRGDLQVRWSDVLLLTRE